MPKTCESCGHKNRKKSGYCAQCGDYRLSARETFDRACEAQVTPLAIGLAAILILMVLAGFAMSL